MIASMQRISATPSKVHSSKVAPRLSQRRSTVRVAAAAQTETKPGVAKVRNYSRGGSFCTSGCPGGSPLCNHYNQQLQPHTLQQRCMHAHLATQCLVQLPGNCGTCFPRSFVWPAASLASTCPMCPTVTADTPAAAPCVPCYPATLLLCHSLLTASACPLMRASLASSPLLRPGQVILLSPGNN